MRLLIIGPPGAGKGTQAQLIAGRYAIPAVSTGDMFRAMQTSATPLAIMVREVMESGGYVTDDLVNQIVDERLSQPDCEHGFLLDGYPRTLQQVDSLDERLARDGHGIDMVISLTANEEEVASRLLKRAAIEGRSDDNEATIRKRQRVYAEQTAPLIEVYRRRGLLLEVDGLGSVEDVWQRLEAGLSRVATGEPVAASTHRAIP